MLGGNMMFVDISNFFLWSMIINLVFYTITVLAFIAMKDLVVDWNQKLFGLDKQNIVEIVYKYIAAYKLIIIAFNFAPWVATMMLR